MPVPATAPANSSPRRDRCRGGEGLANWLKATIAAYAGGSMVTVRNTAILIGCLLLFVIAFIWNPYASAMAAAGAAGVTWWFHLPKPMQE
jgi:hypothetical protein